MKTVLCFVLVLAVLVSLCGCGMKPAEPLPVALDPQPADEDPASAPETAETGTTDTAEPAEDTPADTPSEPVPLQPDYRLTAALDIPASTKDDGEVVLTETAVITFTNTSEDIWDRICLRDYAVANLIEEDKLSLDGRYSTEGSIRGVTDAAGRTLETAVQEDRSVVYVTLAEPLQPGARTSVTVDFETVVPSGGQRFSWFTAGDSNTGGNADTWRTICLSQAYPVLAEYLADGWNEAPYFTDGECFFSPCGSYEMTLTLPADYAVASTGDETKNPDGTWTLTAENVRDFAVIAGNCYEVLTAQSCGVTINSWYIADGTEGARQQGEVSLQAAVDAVAAFTEAWGNYPYGELDVVAAAYNYGGMEYPGMVRITDTFAYELQYEVGEGASGDPKTNLQWDVAHEVAHEWFYAVVGNDQFREAWLDESFAVYGELVYQAYTGSTEEELQARVDGLAREQPMEYIDLSATDYTDPNEQSFLVGYTYAAYKNGPVFLWKLRQAMGADTFDAFLKKWYQDHMFREVTTKEFRAAAEEASGGSQAVLDLMAEYLSPDSEP